MSGKVVVRFAPSPTGPLHIGGVRTALYNYLFAKKHGGTFLLRIEDTDQTRFVPGAEDYIKEALAWSGMHPDGGPDNAGEFESIGPFRQSERKHLYRQYADQLIESGHAYYAFDTSEELDEMRTRMKAAKVASPAYNAVVRESMKNSLTLGDEEVKQRLDNGDPYTVRMKMPRNEEIRFHDEIRGWVVVNTNNLDDKVLYKSDGMPTYHLANIVDDHLMGVSHVIRGEEWLPSAPMHVMLYQFFGWEAPKFAHLPLLLKPDGNGKLSKRDGDRLGFPVFPLEWTDPATGNVSSGYHEQGYFKDAFINLLAMLGWNPGTEQELFSLEEMIEAFSLDRVGKAGAKFDLEKAKWYNQQYLRMLSNKELAEAFKPYATEAGVDVDDETLIAYVNLMKERAHFVEDMKEGLYIFSAPTEYDAKTVKKKWKEHTPALMTELQSMFASLNNWVDAEIEATMKAFMEEREVGMGQVLPNLRLLVSGQGMGPSLTAMMELIGKEECLSRMGAGIVVITN